MLATPGSALDPGLRTDMEQRLGHDFGAVRVHADSRAAASAEAVASLAYTVGSHVVLGRAVAAGEKGRRVLVLAHELVHTIQQGSNRSGVSPVLANSPPLPASGGGSWRTGWRRPSNRAQTRPEWASYR